MVAAALPGGRRSVTDWRRELEARLPLVERLVGSICRRHACYGEAADDFASWVKLRLLEDDCAMLRKYEGRSSLATYLVTVIQNLFHDYRISQWGKWRPSAAARRLGAVAVQLESLLSRDGLSFDEAAEVLRSNLGVRSGTRELAELAGRLPARVRRRFEGEEALLGIGVDDGVEERLEDTERAEAERRTERALSEALAELAGEDRLILKMRFEDGFAVSEIARALHLPQRPLYRRFESCLRRLRKALEERGLGAEEVRVLFGWERSALRIDWAGEARMSQRSPST